MKPHIVDGIATGSSPTSIAAAVMQKPCPMCAAQAVFRSLSGAVTKRAALKRALFKAGLTAHNCGA
jgi:hypothetical protein